MMLFVGAERESNFLLHLYACYQMMPYFYVAVHWNYIRDGLVYLRTMENLPDTLLEKFLVGEHVIYLQKGFWKGVWCDMAIESTYTKTGKGPRGMIGTTTNERTTTIWASRYHFLWRTNY